MALNSELLLLAVPVALGPLPTRPLGGCVTCRFSLRWRKHEGLKNDDTARLLPPTRSISPRPTPAFTPQDGESHTHSAPWTHPFPPAQCPPGHARRLPPFASAQPPVSTSDSEHPENCSPESDQIACLASSSRSNSSTAPAYWAASSQSPHGSGTVITPFDRVWKLKHRKAESFAESTQPEHGVRAPYTRAGRRAPSHNRK